MKKIYFFRAFVVFHFFIILISITHIQEKMNAQYTYCKAVLDVYSKVSYSVVFYAFFAPEIKDGYEFDFTLKGQNASIQQFGFPEQNPEMKNMLHTTKVFFSLDSSTQALCTRSFGVKMLNKYNNLYDTIIITAYIDSFPTYPDYAKGERFSWKPRYQTTIIAHE